MLYTSAYDTGAVLLRLDAEGGGVKATEAYFTRDLMNITIDFGVINRESRIAPLSAGRTNKTFSIYGIFYDSKKD